MKNLFASVTIVAGLCILFVPFAGSNQADDTTIRITGYTPGLTPFMAKLNLVASNTAVLEEIQFRIRPKAGSVTRPLTGTYANYYLTDRGFENPQTGEITLPVYGLYAGRANIVTLTYRFVDGSSKQANYTVTTPTFNDQGCGYNNPTRLQPRTNSTELSYDYLFDRSACGDFSPVILDTDGELRWVSTQGTAGALIATSTFFDNAIYVTQGPNLFRIELDDGSVRLVKDYRDRDVITFHHNIDPGKTGVLIEPDTHAYVESIFWEIDKTNGRVLKEFNMADIISAAMRAGGDDPSVFVYPAPNDWFHNNGAAYNRADDSLIISSRESFVICIDYETKAIKWILGDPSKRWYTFPSLRRFALTLAPGSLPPIGQHSPSVTYDQNLLVFDNGQRSNFQVPPGDQRQYASPRKYRLDLENRIATEVWNFPMNQNVLCPFCGSVYEDAPKNYLVDYALVNGGVPGTSPTARLLGLDSAENTIFYYEYPTVSCNAAYNSIPLHLENTKFPAVGPRVQNLSTRGLVSTGDNVLINGFIVNGTDPKTVVIRALGPSLSSFGLSSVLADPVLTVHNSSGAVIATNDNWQTDIGATFIEQNGLAPSNSSESAALVADLAPGAYTVVVTGKNITHGISLAEVYEIYGPGLNSKLTNVSGRSFVGVDDNVLISGFIVGDLDSATVVVRALGPSLGSFGVSQPLSDPALTIYDSKGSVIATNDNWQDDNHADLVQQNGLAPPHPLEAAMVLHLPAGNYTAIIRGGNAATGNALVEVYHLD
jgi:arylsulfate sulfotransferase